jgi:hypothetical protein
LPFGVVPPPDPFNEHRWLPWPQVFADLLETRLARLDTIREAFETHVTAERETVQQRWKALQSDKTIRGDEGQARAEGLSDDTWALDDIARRSTLMQCVFMYHAVERELWAIFRFRYRAVPEPTKGELLFRVHRWAVLHRDTRRYFGFELDSVSRYSTVNRLRCIANSVKHGDGHVNGELAQVARWRAGTPIEIARLRLPDLNAACLSFITSFVTKAERGMRRSLGRPSP